VRANVENDGHPFVVRFASFRSQAYPRTISGDLPVIDPRRLDTRVVTGAAGRLSATGRAGALLLIAFAICRE
jgi:hypothetical protein